MCVTYVFVGPLKRQPFAMASNVYIRVAEPKREHGLRRFSLCHWVLERLARPEPHYLFTELMSLDDQRWCYAIMGKGFNECFGVTVIAGSQIDIFTVAFL